MPIAVLALTAGAFGIGTTEFVIMGLLLQIAGDLHVSVPAAGLLISGYALGVFVGAPVLTLATRRLPRKQVLLALMAIFTLGNVACALAPGYGVLMTVLGFAGLFTVFTYIQPILTQVSGFPQAAVSPILLVFGLGLSLGNIAGGRLADRRLGPALIGTIACLAVVLALMTPVLPVKAAAVFAVGLLGAAAFATVAPLQLRVLEKAGGAGQNLASSLNIAAFNLGNALGAWAGGLAVAHGPGLAALPLVGAAITGVGFLLAVWSVRRDRTRVPAPAVS